MWGDPLTSAITSEKSFVCTFGRAEIASLLQELDGCTSRRRRSPGSLLPPIFMAYKLYQLLVRTANYERRSNSPADVSGAAVNR